MATIVHIPQAFSPQKISKCICDGNIFCLKWRHGRHVQSLTSNATGHCGQSIPIYLMNNPDKLYSDPIWNDGALGFLKSVAPTRRTTRKTSYIHLSSSETLIAINNGNKFKQQKKSIRKKLCGISAIIYKAASAGSIFNVKLFNTIWPQLNWQLKTKVTLTVSYNLDVTRSEHLHKESVDNEI